MRPGALAVSALLVSVTILACALSSLNDDRTARGMDYVGPPHEHMMLFGVIYEPDGVTPATSVVNVTDKTTGAWYVTASDVEFGGYYMFDTGVLGPHIGAGDVLNVTATEGSKIGWNEVVVAEAWLPYMYLNATLQQPLSSFVLALVPGWNQICLPFTNLSYNASSLGLGKGDVVAGYNSAIQGYDQVFIVGVSPPSMDFRIMPSTGYEIFAAAPRSLTLTGILSSSETRLIIVPPSGGWVELGLASLTPRHASEIPAMYTGGTLVVISKWNPIILTYQTYIPGLPFNDFLILPGEGFWGFATASGTFSYKP